MQTERILAPMMETLQRLLISVAYAQPANLSPETDACGKIGGVIGIFHDGGRSSRPGTGFTCIAEYISNLTFVVIAFAASISLIMLMINGFRYMIGPTIPGGSSDQAKKGITMALVGLAVSLLTYIILDTIVSSVTQ